MRNLRIEQPESDAALKDWQHIHNVIIPTAPLPLDEVRERARRNHLEVAYLDGVLVGCSTVRPPTSAADSGPTTATVIARVLAPHRRQGFGAELYARGPERARASGADMIETVVLSCSADGLRFALAHGFVEVERYLLPDDSIPWVELRLP
ncbi:GNAT family N-acetyltransferase [Streptomyces sp. NPDC048155]|uniref:GNAT family N-acetyltransferase n=1 Tax=Streptomyces sp. NPDC048155 TaxID=3154818 RepID=UPI0033E5F9C2